jgi:hypothetical protein
MQKKNKIFKIKFVAIMSRTPMKLQPSMLCGDLSFQTKA